MENQKVLASVLFILESPRWKAEVGSFLDEYCIVFGNEEENSLEHGKLHNEYAEIVEQVLSERLAENNIEQEAFAISVQAYAQRDIQKDKKNRDAEEGILALGSHGSGIDQLLAVSDYLVFKKIMVKRNLELEMEAAEHHKFEGLSCSKLKILGSKQICFGNETDTEIIHRSSVKFDSFGSKQKPSLQKASKSNTDDSNNARKQCESRDMKESVEDKSMKGNVFAFRVEARQNQDNELSGDEHIETDDPLSDEVRVIRKSEEGRIENIESSPSLARKRLMVDKHNIFINMRKSRHHAKKDKDLNEDQVRRLEYLKQQRDLIHAKNDSKNRKLSNAVVHGTKLS